jgi:hypothetical protein
MAMQASKQSRMSVATQRKWDGANTRKQPPGNSNSDRNAQQTIKRSRSGREKGWSNNDSTAQQSKGSTGWWVVGFGDGLLKPEPLVLADDQERTERITPNVPTDGRGRGPRSYQATKIPTYSDRTSTTGSGPANMRPCAARPGLYTAEEAKTKGGIRTARKVSLRV